MFWSKWFEPKPFNQGYLPEEGGHRVFYHEYGNPDGQTVLVFHGGPGGSCKARHVKSMGNWKNYRITMFDQRGCGLSEPAGEIKNNTTGDLVKDAKRLLDYLGIVRPVIVRGGSWGSTLALLFAERYPEMVEKLLLSQIFLADGMTADWENKEVALFYPEFVGQLQEAAKNSSSIAEYFAGLINSDHPQDQLLAANTYGWWERVRSSLNPKWNTLEQLDEAELASQRIYINYAAQNFMLKDNEIIKNAYKIAHIPVVIIHNRLDFSCPLKGAYLLHKALPKSRFVVVPEHGHVGKLLHKTIKQEMKKELV